jgi:hypothetical protein
MTERNSTLFREIADLMEFRPHLYNQKTWGRFKPTPAQQDEFESRFGEDATSVSADDGDRRWLEIEDCGTEKCLAGHAVAMTGWHPTIVSSGHVTWASVSRKPLQPMGVGCDVEYVGREALGIDERESGILFAGGARWTPGDLRAFAAGDPIGQRWPDEEEEEDEEV